MPMLRTTLLWRLDKEWDEGNQHCSGFDIWEKGKVEPILIPGFVNNVKQLLTWDILRFNPHY
jgi:hypothetical protein